MLFRRCAWLACRGSRIFRSVARPIRSTCDGLSRSLRTAQIVLMTDAGEVAVPPPELLIVAGSLVGHSGSTAILSFASERRERLYRS